MSGQYFRSGGSGHEHVMEDEGPSSKDDYHWTRSDIDKMLRLYLTFWLQMGSRGKYDTLKELFSAIAHEINHSLTSKQVQDKFNRLKKMHKRVKYEDTSGTSRKFAYAKYFDQLETMDENFRKEMLTPSTSRPRGEQTEAAPPSLDADQTAESANAWSEAGVSPGSEFYFIDCALSALRTRKLTPVEGIVLTMKQNGVAAKRMLKAYQERTELLRDEAEKDRKQRDEHFKKLLEFKEKELSIKQRRLAIEEEKISIERSKQFRCQ